MCVHRSLKKGETGILVPLFKGNARRIDAEEKAFCREHLSLKLTPMYATPIEVTSLTEHAAYRTLFMDTPDGFAQYGRDRQHRELFKAVFFRNWN